VHGYAGRNRPEKETETIMPAAYLTAYRNGTLHRRIERSRRWLARCTMCPRFCRVNRLEGETGICKTGRYALISSTMPHFGEEQPLVGSNGSGTIFVTHCHLLCNFCQNFEVSHLGEGTQASPEELAGVMLELQKKGCHNINFVTPSHVLAQILEALPIAIEHGLTLPLVYNCGGYENRAVLRLLDGIVDIYLPDFKFWDPEVARSFCAAPDYPERARQALREMHRQVGDLELDVNNLARRGLLLRHLVMPQGLAGTDQVMEFIAREISVHTYVNIMNQYRPCGKASSDPRIGRATTAAEYQDALAAARRHGLQRLDRRRPAFLLW